MDDSDNTHQLGRNFILKSPACVPRTIRIKSWCIVAFFKLIDEELGAFFADDRCCILADKYLIATVFAYFLRAALRPDEYTRFNFLVALYLAHDMEEDRDDARMELRSYAYIDDPENATPLSFFHRRDKLWERMQRRSTVSRLCCDKVMNLIRPSHHVWSRQRHVNHAGAMRDYSSKRDTCPNCIDDFRSICSSSSSASSSEAENTLTKPRKHCAAGFIDWS